MEKVCNPEELLQAGETIQFAPTGFSMYPFINPKKGDQVIVKPVNVDDLKRGDVVLYRRKGAVGTIDENGFECGILILHRIWKRRGDAFYMVGDNQRKVEGPVNADQIKGVMIAKVRNGCQNSVNQFGYKVKSRVWLCLRPFRPILSKAVAGVKRF